MCSFCPGVIYHVFLLQGIYISSSNINYERLTAVAQTRKRNSDNSPTNLYESLASVCKHIVVILHLLLLLMVTNGATLALTGGDLTNTNT